MTQDNGQSPPAPRLKFGITAELKFDDPDAVAASIPGGSFGILPLDRQDFRAVIRMTNLGGGVSVRSVYFANRVLVRGEIRGELPTVSFLLPCIQGGPAVLNGREVGHQHVSSSNGGVQHQFRTHSAHEIGTIAAVREVVLEAYDALAGGSVPAYLNEDSNIQSDPALVRRLNALHRQGGELLRMHRPEDLHSLAAPGLSLLRDTVLATLVGTITAGTGKSDHLATRRQTASMARIDRYIDDHPHDLARLQDLCSGTGMALRTIETIIRSRTGLTALDYLRCRRLVFARKELLSPADATTVTRVALAYGFLHLGRFAIEYREAFGESPSATLMRALGRKTEGR